MLTCFRYLLCGAFLTLATANASATSACPDADGCLSEWPVMILVSMEAQLKYCPSLASLSDVKKEALLREEFKVQGAPGYLDRLRATGHYANRPDIDAIVKENPEEIKELCKELMIKPK